jgi:Cft2 family RNA processing exonuclease
VVRQSYGGPIYATKATCELLRILWLDSSHIQEMEAGWQTCKNKRVGKKGVEPLYETPDAEAAIGLLQPLKFDAEQELLPGMRARFVQAKHILGTASLFLTLVDQVGQHRRNFFGDLGRPDQLPADMPVFLNSPLVIAAAVIISGKGMDNAGRIKRHLTYNVWRSECPVVIVGFLAQGTTGRLLVDDATKVKIFREDVAVQAKLHTIEGFSAHADHQDELLAWLGGLAAPPGLKINLVHADKATTLDFQALAAKRFPKMQFYLPRWNKVLPLAPQPLEVPLPVRPLEQGTMAIDEKCLGYWKKALPEPTRKAS